MLMGGKRFFKHPRFKWIFLVVIMIKKQFLSDKDVAIILSISPSWVRKQRFLRNKNEPHVLDIDPVYLGKSPRYRSNEISEWINLQ